MYIQKFPPLIVANVKFNTTQSQINYTNNVSDVFINSKNPSFCTALPDNFGTVIENKIIRGAVPKSLEELKSLKEMGTTFILDLVGAPRTIGKINDTEAKWAEELGIEYCYKDGYSLSWNNENLKAVVELIDEKSKEGIVFIHCTLGKVRTGRVIAYYQGYKGIPDEEIRKHAQMFDVPKMDVEDTILNFNLGCFERQIAP